MSSLVYRDRKELRNKFFPWMDRDLLTKTDRLNPRDRE